MTQVTEGRSVQDAQRAPRRARTAGRQCRLLAISSCPSPWAPQRPRLPPPSGRNTAWGEGPEMRACARDFLARFFPGERFGRHAACEQLRAGACACASQLSCSCPVGWVAAPDRRGRKNRREGAQEGVAPPRMRVWAAHPAPGLALCTSEQGSTARAAPARSASSLSTRSSSSPHGRAGFRKFRFLPENGDLVRYLRN